MKIREIIERSIDYLKKLDKEKLEGCLSVTEIEYRNIVSSIIISCNNHPYLKEREKLFK